MGRCCCGRRRWRGPLRLEDAADVGELERTPGPSPDRSATSLRAATGTASALATVATADPSAATTPPFAEVIGYQRELFNNGRFIAQHDVRVPHEVTIPRVPHTGRAAHSPYARGVHGELDKIAAVLRSAGARFAFLFGSRATGEARPGSDFDVAAWWGGEAPDPWDVPLPSGVDLVILDRAPLWLAGRVAMTGQLLFDDDPPARVEWQADTRLVYLDDLPYVLERQREWAEVIARGR